MKKTFKGRVVLGGNISGEALVTRAGLNILASFQKSAMKKQKIAVCSDQNNKDIYNKVMTDKIICLPQTIGSTTGGIILQTGATMGMSPKAMLFSEHIDTLAGAGIILTDVWENIRIITVDQLGPEFLKFVETGYSIEIKEDGTVIVEDGKP
jgi:predicted aconitase with swiveling domain